MAEEYSVKWKTGKMAEGPRNTEKTYMKTLKNLTLNVICHIMNGCTVDTRGGSDVAGRTKGMVNEGQTDLDRRLWWRSMAEGDR